MLNAMSNSKPLKSSRELLNECTFILDNLKIYSLRKEHFRIESVHSCQCQLKEEKMPFLQYYGKSNEQKSDLQST